MQEQSTRRSEPEALKKLGTSKAPVEQIEDGDLGGPLAPEGIDFRGSRGGGKRSGVERQRGLASDVND